MRRSWLFLLVALFVGGCTSTSGSPVDEAQLGFMTCDSYFECGPGRYCSEAGFCSADCRTTGDCSLLGEGMLCNLFGQCLEPDGKRRCSEHEDCGEGRYCNGICKLSGATCGAGDPCPYGEPAGDVCEGTCGGHCGSDNDCLVYNQDRKPENHLECTPVGQCLQYGWEKWIPLGELPPTACSRDAQCKVRGWRWHCDCEKELDSRTGRMVCDGGAESVCVPDPDYDFGCGDPENPDHELCGVWGMRMVIGTVTYGIPLIPEQPTYSTNLFLIKIGHEGGGKLRLEEKVCDIQLINFKNDDQPFIDMGWMLIPTGYFLSLPILEQEAVVPAATPGARFLTTQSNETRGMILADPWNDPLPTRAEYEANPDDPRFWDQDEDGNVGMTTMMDGVLRGAVYNVQRWKGVYDGEVLDSDHIRGPATIENEQLQISANKDSLVYDTETVMHPDPTRTYFRLLRMDRESSCADLVREGERDDSFLRHTNHMMDVPDP